MTIHKEGKGMLLTLLVMLALVILASFVYFGTDAATFVISALCIAIFLFFLNFFRNPNREFVGFAFYRKFAIHRRHPLRHYSVAVEIHGVEILCAGIFECPADFKRVVAAGCETYQGNNDCCYLMK